MKLLYIHGTPLDSQSANIVQVINMCEAFCSCGVEVLLATPYLSDKTLDPYSVVKTHLGSAPSFKITFFKKFTILGRFVVLGNYFGAKKLIKRSECDICFVRDPLLFRLALKENLPTIFESHNYLMHDKSNFLSKFWQRDTLKNSSALKLKLFITISQELSKYWKNKGVPAEKILPLHDGFNESSFSQQLSRYEARKKIGLPVNRKTVVYAGRINHDREPERIINLAERFPEVHFVVIGGPEDQKTKLKKLSEELNIKNVTWKGHVSHSSVRDYLFAADILLMIWSKRSPIVNHFSPLKMFEYMAAGRVIVGQAFPTIKEVLRHGESAFLADPDSFDDLVKQLKIALDIEYPSKIASMAREIAVKKYSWQARAQKILDGIGFTNGSN